MKHLLLALPLLLTIGAIAFFIAACALSLRIFTPDALGLGAGILTCLGLGSMAAADQRSPRSS